ncbi:MAG: mechanosensitive ion channel family protein [Gammaproteobacteria bacterium]
MTPDLPQLPAWLQDTLGGWTDNPGLLGQGIAILVALVLSGLLSALFKPRLAALQNAAVTDPLPMLRRGLGALRSLTFPLLLVFLLGIAVTLASHYVAQSWLVRLAQSIAAIVLLVAIAERFIRNSWLVALARWVGIPVAALHVFGWLDDVTGYLDGISLEVGNIHVSLYALLRTLIFGSVLFWLGRMSNVAGKQVIRTQLPLDAGTREVFAKLFEIALFIVIGLLVLQVMGINLTALAVFGGALGVGLGFGLQQIASNFISGIIILLDRSITLGDYIELDGGRAGTLVELNMRYAVLKTFDGKGIMVPNETFVTTSFINWTHADTRQRHSLTFSVAYRTDLDRLLPRVREVVAAHPQVISGPEVPLEQQPDAEIRAFGDSGIEILVEFWMEGIDDGRNRVGADLLLALWRALREENIEIPFPQREVRILQD